MQMNRMLGELEAVRGEGLGYKNDFERVMEEMREVKLENQQLIEIVNDNERRLIELEGLV